MFKFESVCYFYTKSFFSLVSFSAFSWLTGMTSSLQKPAAAIHDASPFDTHFIVYNELHRKVGCLNKKTKVIVCVWACSPVQKRHSVFIQD